MRKSKRDFEAHAQRKLRGMVGGYHGHLVLTGAHACNVALQPIQSAKKRVLLYTAAPAVPAADYVVLIRGVHLGDGAWTVPVNIYASLKQ